MVLVAIVVVLMSTNLEAQKAYHKVTLENGITELNNMANRLIEKCKIKFDLNNSVIVSEMQPTCEVAAENELNEIIDNYTASKVKYDVNTTISVIEFNEEDPELNLFTDELMTSMKFDVNESISVTEDGAEITGLDQLTDELIANTKFDVNQTISVSDFNLENTELDQLTDDLITSIVKFDLNKTNSVQEDQIAFAF